MEQTGIINYYKNTGTNSAPVFTEQTGTDNPFDGVDVGNVSKPTFVDIDNDGDFDAPIGEQDGIINYFNNTSINNTDNALDFDGNNDYVTVADDNALDFLGCDAFTLECWVYYDGISADAGSNSKLFIKRDVSGVKYQLYINDADDKLVFNSSGASAVSNNTAITQDVWTHVVLTYINGNVIFYVNGVAGGSSNHNIGSNTNSAPVYIGRDGFASQNALFGKMDEARIWNIALEASDIANLYNDKFSDPTSPASCLVAYYQMDESSGTNLPDETGNNHQGTLVNMDNSDWVATGASITEETAPLCSNLFVHSVRAVSLLSSTQASLQEILIGLDTKTNHPINSVKK